MIFGGNRLILWGVYHERYQQWNLALADKLLNGADERVQLTVSASLLAAAWEQQAAEYLSSEEAERQFVEAVAEFYRHYVRFSGLEVLSRQDENGVPRSVAFLALSVLAAGLMHDDGTYAAHDYYHRLSHLLGYDDVPPPGLLPSLSDLFGGNCAVGSVSRAIV